MLTRDHREAVANLLNGKPILAIYSVRMEKAQASISFVHEECSAGLQTGCCAGVLARICSGIITKSNRAFAISDRDSGFDSVVVCADPMAGVFQKSRARQSFHIRTDITVITAERLGQSPDAGYVVAPHVAQQLHPLAGKDAGQSLPIFKGKKSLVEALRARRDAMRR